MRISQLVFCARQKPQPSQVAQVRANCDKVIIDTYNEPVFQSAWKKLAGRTGSIAAAPDKAPIIYHGISIARLNLAHLVPLGRKCWKPLIMATVDGAPRSYVGNASPLVQLRETFHRVCKSQEVRVGQDAVRSTRDV